MYSQSCWLVPLVLPLVCILPVQTIQANLYFHSQNTCFHCTRCNTYVCVSLSFASQKQKYRLELVFASPKETFSWYSQQYACIQSSYPCPLPKQKYRLVGIDMLKTHVFTISDVLPMYPIMLFSATPARRSSYPSHTHNIRNLPIILSIPPLLNIKVYVWYMDSLDTISCGSNGCCCRLIYYNYEPSRAPPRGSWSQLPIWQTYRSHYPFPRIQSQCLRLIHE